MLATACPNGRLVGKAKIPLARPTLVEVWRDNSRRVRTHEKKIGAPVRPLGKIILSIFCAQSGISTRWIVCKWFGESR